MEFTFPVGNAPLLPLLLIYQAPASLTVPHDTVPKKIDQLFKAHLFHHMRQNEERSHPTRSLLSLIPIQASGAPLH